MHCIIDDNVECRHGIARRPGGRRAIAWRQETSDLKKKTLTRKRMRLQNDTGSLLRSRPLQALLVTVAAAQVVAVGSGKTVQADQPRTVRELAARAASAGPVGQIPAVVIAAPVKVAKARTAKAPARKSASE